MPDLIKCSAQEIRLVFNATSLLSDWSSGLLRVVLERTGDPTAAFGYPAGTRYAVERWYRGLEPVAVVHYFRFPDGTTSKPDPKWLKLGSTVYRLRAEGQTQDGGTRDQ
jgi:hypothetical protein